MSEAAKALWPAKSVEITQAIAAGHLRRASGLLRETAEYIGLEAEKSDGLLSDHTGAAAGDGEAWEVGGTTPALPAGPVDLTSCMRGAHSEGPLDANGWKTCVVCGRINLFPKAT